MAETWNYDGLRRKFSIPESSSNDAWVTRTNLKGNPRDYNFTFQAKFGSASGVSLWGRGPNGTPTKIGDFDATNGEIIIDAGEHSGFRAVFTGGAEDGVLSGFATHKRIA